MVSAQVTRYLKGLTITATIAGSPLLWNYTHNHNVSIDTDHTFIFRKMDGWIAHSQVEISYARNDLILYRTDPFGRGYRRYSDSNRDGILDSVRIETSLLQTGGVEGTFNTNNHAQTHHEIFERENKLYRQELQEFAEQYQTQYPEKFKQLGLDKILGP